MRGFGMMIDMRIIKKSEAVRVSKPEGTDVDYFLFDDYEVHYNEQAPGTMQTWHHHEEIWETLYIIDGELVARWREDGEEKTQVVRAGDLIESERSAHTFTNESDTTVRFLVIKRIPTNQDYKEVFKNDKVLD
jgi:uncharacterized cupin superfamily protein